MGRQYYLTGDPAFIALIERARAALDFPPDADISPWIRPALDGVRTKTAIDVIELRNRYAQPTALHRISVTPTPEDMQVVVQLFHQFSMTMPAGVKPLPWPVFIIIQIALTVYCENVITRSRIRLV